jgi:hypothetical protein
MTEKESLLLQKQIIEMIIAALKKGGEAKTLDEMVYRPIQQMHRDGKFDNDLLSELQGKIDLKHILEIIAFTRVTKSGLYFNECRDLASRYHMTVLSFCEKEFNDTGVRPEDKIMQSFRDYERLVDEIGEGTVDPDILKMIHELPPFDQFTDDNKIKAMEIFNRHIPANAE